MVPGRWGFHISRQSVHGGNVVNPTHGPHSPSLPLNIRGTHFLYSLLGAIMRPEGLCQWKIPMTPIENRTRDLPAFSSMPQPTAPSRAPNYIIAIYLSGGNPLSLSWRRRSSVCSSGSRRLHLADCGRSPDSAGKAEYERSFTTATSSFPITCCVVLRQQCTAGAVFLCS